MLASLSAGCDDAACEDTLTCDVGDTASTSSGSGGAASSSSSQATTSTGGGGDPGTDTTPPTVLSVTPSVDATGVSDAATILISFSEPMNRVATQNAFQSSTLTGLSFAWPDDQTMEVTPSNLTYAQGGHDVVANEYSYTITTLAADLAGNQIEDNGTWSFSTLREVDDVLPKIHESVITQTGTSPSCFSYPAVRLGRIGSSHCRSVVTFDISVIPATAQLQAATLSCSYLSAVGNAPTSSLLTRIDYLTADATTGYSAPALESFLDPYSFESPTSIQTNFAIDMMPTVAAEVANSASTLQFRTQVTPSPMIGDSGVVFQNVLLGTGGCSNGFSVIYLAH